MGYAAKVIVFDDVRASQQRQALRQQLHAHFDRWLDEIEAEFPESAPTLAQVSEPIWGKIGIRVVFPEKALSIAITKGCSMLTECA